MEQEKLAEMIKSLIEKDKENFIKKEGIVKTKKYKTGKEVSVNKKSNIDFDKNTLLEFDYKDVDFENEKSIRIKLTELGHKVWFNKTHCYPSKKYQYKQSFFVKVFNDMHYNTNAASGDIEKYEYITGDVLIKGLKDEE